MHTIASSPSDSTLPIRNFLDIKTMHEHHITYTTPPANAFIVLIPCIRARRFFWTTWPRYKSQLDNEPLKISEEKNNQSPGSPCTPPCTPKNYTPKLPAWPVSPEPWAAASFLPTCINHPLKSEAKTHPPLVASINLHRLALRPAAHCFRAWRVRSCFLFWRLVI